MATVKLIQRLDKLNSKKEAPVYVQYSHDSKTLLFATGIKIEAKYWDSEDRKIYRYKDSNLQTKYNKKLKGLEGKILGIASDIEDKGGIPTVSNVKEAYEKAKRDNLPEAELSKSILVLWRDYLETRKSGLAERTYNSEKNSIDALEGFLEKEKLTTLKPENFNLKHLSKFEAYLSTEAKKSRKQKKEKEEGKPLSKNTIAKRKKHFKTFLKYHLKLKGSSIGFDLSDLKYKETPAPKVYLTEEELEQFEYFEFEKEKHQKIRDLFILGCNTGLRISDLKRLDKNIVGSKIMLTTQKNNKEVAFPITPTVRRILESYNYNLPQYSEDKFRVYLREAFKICFPDSKIQVRNGKKFISTPKHELISPHDAIRTFITLSAERGMSFNSIAQIVGKAPAVILKHYLGESQKVAEKQMVEAWGYSPLRVAK
jgi:integrase